MNGNYKGTEHYTLTKTENGWHGDPNDCEWQWFDFPDLTFTDDGDCRFELEAEALARLIGERRRGAVFREDSGARLRQQTAVGIVSSVALRVGVPDISPHSLRRTFCTLSRDAGVPDRDIMAAGGWNSPQMLDYYDMSRRGLNGKAGDGLQDYLGKED